MVSCVHEKIKGILKGEVMSMFGKLAKIAINTVTLPVDVAKDTLDMMIGDYPKNVIKKCEKIMDTVDELGE